MKAYVLMQSTKDLENEYFEVDVLGVYKTLGKLKQGFSSFLMSIQTDEHIINESDGFAEMYIEDVEEIKIWYEEKVIDDNPKNT